MVICDICTRSLDDGVLESTDCGGICLECLADATTTLKNAALKAAADARGWTW